SRVQYRDDIDKFSTHTIDRDIRKSWDDQDSSAGDNTGARRPSKPREPSNAVHYSSYRPAGSSGIILCNVAMNLFKLAKGSYLVSDISFRQAIKHNPNLFLASQGFVITKRALDFGNLLWAEDNILCAAIEN